MARSYLSWGEALSEPRPGAIAVLSRGFDPRLGHVGFLVGATSNDVILLGGNQGDAVRVQPFPRSRLLGLRWASTAAASPPLAERQPDAPAVGDIFERALAHVLEMEGGYDDDPYDPGGPTNLGITLAVYAHSKGVELTADNIGALKSELKQIPVETARRIYRDRYWLAAACRQLPPPLAVFHFDTAVNHGVDGAARMLQQAVKVDSDGEIGPATLAAIAARPIQQTLGAYAEIRRQRYRSLAHFWRFGKGWLRRVDATLALATSLNRAIPPTSSTPQPTEKQPMSTEIDNTAQPTADRAQVVGPLHDHLGRRRHHALDRASRAGPGDRPQHHRRAHPPARRQCGAFRAGARRPRRHRSGHLRPRPRQHPPGTAPGNADPVIWAPRR